ncbi:MAG TPA: TIGR01244 family sulfur transferase [Brevundimonas sp.]|nr:TIGR01244 family sulfur transferase [Brevundimonas sp.]
MPQSPHASPRPLSPTVWASPQLAPDVLKSLADAGVRRLINNRPDGEDPGQPTAAAMEAAANEAGLIFVWIPVAGLPTPEQVQAVGQALADGQPTVMFCRSGMRSAAIWAMSERLNGVDAEDLRSAVAAAGYDLSRLPL